MVFLKDRHCKFYYLHLGQEGLVVDVLDQYGRRLKVFQGNVEVIPFPDHTQRYFRQVSAIKEHTKKLGLIE
jgi:hypothetical protein